MEVKFMESQTRNYSELSADYARIEQAIRYLEMHATEQPSLSDLAASVNLSEYYFQHLFTRWVGISPKRFLQYLTKEHAKEMLARSGDLLEVTYASGLSSPGRLHDLFVTYEAVTPGEYKRRGAGLELLYGFHPSPFGECLIALTERGISNLVFISESGRQNALEELRAAWPGAVLRQDESRTRQPVEQIFSLLCGDSIHSLQVYLHGTNFQLKVWEALMRVPAGSLVSYEDLAVYIGLPRASRAVGSAVGRNPIPVLIPCHRVIYKSGEFGNYRWGATRKKAILGFEAAYQESLSEITL
jgi:AraC family transcriptional regulator of adaptative response/methylated-DNA-[protein]-cysteine methyltransferase